MIKKKQITEVKTENFKENDEEIMKELAQNHINTKILKLQKEDEERKAYEDIYNERDNQDEEISDIEDEQDWSWYKPDDENVYFIVTTAYPYYKD